MSPCSCLWHPAKHTEIFSANIELTFCIFSQNILPKVYLSSLTKSTTAQGTNNSWVEIENSIMYWEFFLEDHCPKYGPEFNCEDITKNDRDKISGFVQELKLWLKFQATCLETPSQKQAVGIRVYEPRDFPALKFVLCKIDCIMLSMERVEDLNEKYKDDMHEIRELAQRIQCSVESFMENLRRRLM